MSRYDPTMLAEAGMPNFIDQNTAVAIVGVGAAVFGYLYLRGAAKRKPKRSDPLDDLAGKKSLAQQRNLERDMQQLLLELTDMTRQMNAQIDTKAAKLETLIQDAEQAEQRLRAALGESGQIDTPVQPLTADQFPEPRRQATAANGATNGDRTAMNNIELPDAKSPLARHDEVYRLADEGVSVDDIAQRTSRPRGEIDLILALRRT